MVRPRHRQRRRRSARHSCCAPAFPGRSTSADHVEIIRRALDQAGSGPRPGRRVLARTDGAGGTKETIEPLTRRRASCSVGVHPARPHRRPTGTIPQTAWSPAYNADGHPGNGAHAAETRRPAGPNRMAPGHAGQPRATSSPTRATGRASRTSQKPPAHRPRHQYKRRPAPRPRDPPPATNPPPENRIRRTKDTRLDHVPSQNLAQNRIWRPIMAPARRPADLLPDAGPGRRLRPRLGTQDDPPATDEHPRRHHPPHPTHRPPPQNRPPPEHLTA